MPLVGANAEGAVAVCRLYLAFGVHLRYVTADGLQLCLIATGYSPFDTPLEAIRFHALHAVACRCMPLHAIRRPVQSCAHIHVALLPVCSEVVNDKSQTHIMSHLIVLRYVFAYKFAYTSCGTPYNNLIWPCRCHRFTAGAIQVSL